MKGIKITAPGQFNIFTHSGHSTREYELKSNVAKHNPRMATTEVRAWVKKLAKYTGLRGVDVIEKKKEKSITGAIQTNEYHEESKTIFGQVYDAAGLLQKAPSGSFSFRKKVGAKGTVKPSKKVAGADQCSTCRSNVRFCMCTCKSCDQRLSECRCE